jgi:citrate synthase
MNTAPVKSRISFIDGGKGILRYRGVPIQQLAENSTFLEVPSQPSECYTMCTAAQALSSVSAPPKFSP